MNIVKALALVVSLALPAASFAQATTSTTTTAADALGTWNASFNTQQGVINAVLKLEKSGDKVTGSIGGPDGTTPVEAEVKGKTLTVWFNYAGGGGGTPIPIEMSGSIDGDSAKGTMTAGGSPAGDWTATRAKDAAKKPDTTAKSDTTAKPDTTAKSGNADLSGAWNVSLALDAITATPSMTLKQDGSKLTGEYVSQQYGKFPLTGEVTGTAVTFSVSMNIEGNAISAVYTGVVQADGSLKGTVDLGGAMSGTFSASRKK
jgi:hypothetical protein